VTRSSDGSDRSIEAIFKDASALMSRYRDSMGVLPHGSAGADATQLGKDRQGCSGRKSGSKEEPVTPVEQAGLQPNHFCGIYQIDLFMDIRDVVVIGSGCAGHTAASISRAVQSQTARFGRPSSGRTTFAHHPGGKFPRLPDGIQGPELIENMRKQAQRFGADYRMGHVVKLT